MKRLGGLLRKQDAFGEPVSINYRGDTTFTTMLGAIVSFVEKIFILVVAVMGLIDLFTYQDPNITMYSVYDARLDGKEISLEEANVNIIFGIYNKQLNQFVKLDPRFGKLTIGQLSVSHAEDLEKTIDE